MSLANIKNMIEACELTIMKVVHTVPKSGKRLCRHRTTQIKVLYELPHWRVTNPRGRRSLGPRSTSVPMLRKRIARRALASTTLQ